ncbi:hypothetical protein T4A_1048 [Trichinella pseudospiralis]|uniref:Uncharacterized protein n=1 Tax=Trichinella pseudospiralis TaxID=6337 RepID=A0A0V1E3M4_TRIPS|nr:hypothetical protein T4A_1048 [Trichinella pseudospiralis]
MIILFIVTGKNARLAVYDLDLFQSVSLSVCLSVCLSVRVCSTHVYFVAIVYSAYWKSSHVISVGILISRYQMRSKRPITETESYELVQQTTTLQHTVKVLIVNYMKEFSNLKFTTRQLLSCKRFRLKRFTVTEECTFQYRLLKEIIQSNPLDGMVEVIIIRQKNDENEAKRILIRLNEYLENYIFCCKYATVISNIGGHSQDCLHINCASLERDVIFCCLERFEKTAAETNAHQERSISLKIALICGNQFFASNKCDQQIMSNRNVHLPTAMAVSTVNYMQYDSSPDVWNFDDQEKELSDVELMALQLANFNCIVQVTFMFLYKYKKNKF